MNIGKLEKFLGIGAIGIVVVLAGCLGPQGVPMPGGRRVPAVPRWSVGPKSVHGSKGEHFPEVRIYEAHTYEDAKILNGIDVYPQIHHSRYLILWPSGHVLSVWIGSPASIAVDYDDWNGGDVGYYEIIDGREISIEVYLHDPGKWRMVYCQWRYILDGDAIRDETNRPGVRRDLLPPRVLTRKDIDITLIPDW